MPPRNLVFIMLTATVSFVCYLKAERNRYASQVSEAMKLVTDLYIEKVDRRDLFEDAVSGMVGELDQYSAYIGPEVFKQMEQTLDQEFGGVGIEVEKESDEHPILVLSPMFGSPGYRAGLRAGDRILAIDGAKTIGMKQKDAISKMRGKAGSKVTLLVKHVGSPDEVEIQVEREVIMVDSLLGDKRLPDGTWQYALEDHPEIGYLRLTTFGKHSVDELKKALLEEGRCRFRAIILDMRNNAGGLLDAAVDTCNLFIDRGRIVSTRGRGGVERATYDANGTAVIPETIPMVVLVNRYSASASEIVAACLQDHGRAVVIGEKTWGKGTVQNLFPLEGGRSALKLTTASYWRPSGKDIHRAKDAPEDGNWGVQPNEGFQIKLTDEELERMLRARRERDLGRPVNSVPKPEGPSAETPNTTGQEKLSNADTTEQPPPPADDQSKEDAKSSPDPAAAGSSSALHDPQLEKAIEYLESKLRGSADWPD